MKVKIPNLPQNKVNLFVCADRRDVASALEKTYAELIKIKKSDVFEPCECDHPDMHICHLGGKKVVVYKEDNYICSELLRRGFDVIFAETKKTKKYPSCAALNVCFIGKILLCNKKAADKSIVSFAEQNGYRIIDCKQGYSRCSTLVVSQNAVITDDVSVYKSLKDEIDVLVVSKCNIILEGNRQGFIGGCAGHIDKNKLAFFGNIETHPDFLKIDAFLTKHGVEYVSLGSDKLCDVGTIIPLCEE